MENYFNYFTEVEEHFRQRSNGPLIRLSTMDWTLIEVWKNAGIPLPAVLRGIDAAFDRYDQRPSKTRKVNSLAYCSQEVLAAAEDMKEAAVGASEAAPAAKPSSAPGFEAQAVVTYLRRNADLMEGAAGPLKNAEVVRGFCSQAAQTLRHLADDTANGGAARLEDLERRLTVLEEKLFAVLLTSTPDEEIVTIRTQADRDLAPYRRKMSGAQIDQLQKQYVYKRLIEKYRLPRLSLFYL